MPRISDWEPAAHTPCFRALHACGAAKAGPRLCPLSWSRSSPIAGLPRLLASHSSSHRRHQSRRCLGGHAVARAGGELAPTSAEGHVCSHTTYVREPASQTIERRLDAIAHDANGQPPRTAKTRAKPVRWVATGRPKQRMVRNDMKRAPGMRPEKPVTGQAGPAAGSSCAGWALGMVRHSPQPSGTRAQALTIRYRSTAAITATPVPPANTSPALMVASIVPPPPGRIGIAETSWPSV